MKSNMNILWVLAIFCFFLSALYTFWSLNDADHLRVEWVGTIALALSGILAAFIAFYLGLVHRKQGGELPEDTLTANIDDGDPELGHFAPWSWWPLMLVASISVVFLGIGIGGNFWLAFWGVPFVLVGLVGWVYEFYRGRHAH